MKKLLVCINRAYRADMPSCGARDGEAIAAALEAGISEREIPVECERIRCFGWCYRGPNIRIEGGPAMHEVTVGDVPRILDALSEEKPTLPKA